MSYVQKGNPVPVTSCGRRRVERVKNLNTKKKSTKPGKLKLKRK
jgi:hypothetical protein|tara:strand:+ start:679 stop:810 length:132 start_codon:yes stop_codon:yes gene_type:complete